MKLKLSNDNGIVTHIGRPAFNRAAWRSKLGQCSVFGPHGWRRSGLINGVTLALWQTLQHCIVASLSPPALFMYVETVPHSDADNTPCKKCVANWAIQDTIFVWWTHLSFQYDAKSRASAGVAMRHPYFNTLGPSIHKLPDGKDQCFPGAPLFVKRTKINRRFVRVMHKEHDIAT